MFKANLSLFCLFVALFAGCWCQNAPASGLVEHARVDQIDAIADQTHGLIKWSNGAFLYLDAGVPGMPSPYTTLDRDGKVISTCTFKIPEASHVIAIGFSRSADGTVVAVGQADSFTGQLVPFLAIISADGSSSRIVNTAPYFPNVVTVAPDGTIWTVGMEMIDLNPRAEGLDPEAPVLRQFDRTGKPLRSAIPQSEFLAFPHLRALADGFLVVTSDRVGWYGGRAGAPQQYSEISLADMSVKTYAGLDAKFARHGFVSGFALTPSGNAVLTNEDHGTLGYRIAYTLDRTANAWVSMDVPAMAGSRHAPQLVGNEGEDLIFKSGQTAVFLTMSH